MVLVHGLGGSGKSRLLSQFRDMAQGRIPGSPVSPGQVRTVWLDWEDEQRDDPGRYAELAGPSLVTVLDAVQKAVIAAFAGDARAADRAGQAFADYRQGAARMPEYKARFLDVLARSRQSGSPFTSEDAAALLKAVASAGLVAAGHPGGVLGLTPDQLAAAMQAGGHLSAAATRAVTGKRPGDLSPQEYDLVTDAPRELTRRAAAAIQAAPGRAALVVLLDTGEVIGDRAWGWLRRVMTHTGSRVAWVVGARFETEAEGGFDSPVAQFVRDIGNEHLMLMSPTRFDNAMIRAYLEGRRNARNCTDVQIDMIAQFTKGLPLAVSFTATLLEQGQPVEDVCREVDDGHRGSVVSRLARRYLVHAEQQAYPADDPRRDDLMKILSLALAFGDLSSDPELLAALWNTDGDLPAAFRDLARRHDFVLPVSRRLHDDVRDTLRTDLLDPWQRESVRQINQRALAVFDARLTDKRRRWPTLDEQLDHTGFTTALLAALWYALWADNQAGLDLFTGVLPVLAAADPPTSDAAAAMMEQFAGTFDQDQQRDLDLLTQIRPSSPWLSGGRGATARAARQVKITLAGLALHPPGSATADTLIGEPGDRRVAVMILRAGLRAGENDEAAVATLRTAAAQTSSTRFHQAIGSQAQAIASRLIWAGPGDTSVLTATGLAAAKIATEMLTNNTSAWDSYAAALFAAGRFEDALAAYDRAVAFDPGDAAHFHRNRGITLMEMGRPEEALAAYDRAVALDPGNAGFHRDRGDTLMEMGRPEEALAAYDRAVALDPGNAGFHRDRGDTLMEMGRPEEALAAYDRAVALDPGNAGFHRDRGDTLMEMGRPEEALAAYDRAVALDPGNAIFHGDRGYVLRRLGRPEEALAAHDRAVALDPGNAIFHGDRGETLRNMGRFEDALAAYDRAVVINPSSCGAHVDKGMALAAIDHLDQALAEFDTADRLATDAAGEGKTWAGAILWHRRDTTGARDRFAHVKGRVTECTPFRTAEMEALALCALGQPDDAEKHLLNALPLRAPGDGAEPQTIYNLLSDPPLPGIDRLRAIVDIDT